MLSLTYNFTRLLLFVFWDLRKKERKATLILGDGERGIGTGGVEAEARWRSWKLAWESLVLLSFFFFRDSMMTDLYWEILLKIHFFIFLFLLCVAFAYDASNCYLDELSLLLSCCLDLFLLTCLTLYDLVYSPPWWTYSSEGLIFVAYMLEMCLSEMFAGLELLLNWMLCIAYDEERKTPRLRS